jgi:cell division protein FtsN
VASKKPEQIPVKTVATPVVQPKKEPTTPPQKETAPDKVVYRVQVASSPSPLETTGDKWKKIEFLYTTREAGQYKYMAGDFNSEKEAINARNYLSGAGWKGCFVVAYINDKRVSVESLRKP